MASLLKFKPQTTYINEKELKPSVTDWKNSTSIL